ncbi:MAG: undecaprenyl-diphosphate phosphatase [Eubacteriales bacterium]|nr:undecaprenyl-diphosphate phosphatase [Eubacteriales bacterium]
MTILNAIILGVIQGITEFLPVSSTGHLCVLNNLFDIVTVSDGHLLFDVLLKLGTLSAVIVVYWQDIAQMFFEMLHFVGVGPLAGKQQPRYPAARLFIMLVFATLPLLLAVPIRRMMDALYYRSFFVGAAIILTGCVLYVSDKMVQGKKRENGITAFDAVIIGLCQCISVIPGLSRTGISVTAGISTGLRADFALKFSYLLSLPAFLGAVILELADALKQGIDLHNIPAYLIGMLGAMLAGIAALSFMRKFFERGKFGGFAYYCWVFGVLSIILTLIF